MPDETSRVPEEGRCGRRERHARPADVRQGPGWIAPWELVSSFPQGLDTIFGGAEDFARIANEMSDGQIEVTVYPAGAMVGGFEVYDAVSSGAFQLAHSAPTTSSASAPPTRCSPRSRSA
jgi:TRAP-type mannitol/chloroaromatic compound transport system substrate-binding protein